jgi:putative membrane protein
MEPYVPFCGVPPTPEDLWGRWLFDPWLLAGLALGLAGGLMLAQNPRRFSVGWALVALLFVSPLCAASMALFSARVAQHVLLTLLAAPIIASALPKLRLPALPIAGLFAVLFWTWHAPGPYDATLQGDLVYWTMHLSLFGSAVLLFAAMRAAPERALAAAALTSAQMTGYAVMLTFAAGPWHTFHLVTTHAYGIGPLADQQLAGGLMWIAGGLLFLAAVGVLAFRFVQSEAQDHRPMRPR